MTPYLNTLAPLTTEILNAAASKPSRDTELWRSVIATLTTSFQVDDAGEPLVWELDPSSQVIDSTCPCSLLDRATISSNRTRASFTDRRSVQAQNGQCQGGTTSRRMFRSFRQFDWIRERAEIIQHGYLDDDAVGQRQREVDRFDRLGKGVAEPGRASTIRSGDGRRVFERMSAGREWCCRSRSPKGPEANRGAGRRLVRIPRVDVWQQRHVQHERIIIWHTIRRHDLSIPRKPL